MTGTIASNADTDCEASIPGAHGTGMAGAIASHRHLLGVAPRVKVIAICAFDGAQQAQGTSFKIIQGLNYAIQHQARIVNMSFAGPRDWALSQSLQLAREKGILVIAAAGNNGPKSPPAYPGADPNVLAVTAVDEKDELLSVANQGRYVTVAAPGVNVLVPAPGNGMQFTTGTSVATAHVTGVAALLLSQKPTLKPADVRAILVATARHLGARGVNPQFGAGLVDPLGALAMLVSWRSPAEEGDIKRLLASIDASQSRADGGFSALGYAGGGSPATPARPSSGLYNWLAWIDMRGTDFSRTTFGDDLKGMQVNATAGLTRKLSPDFLIGVLGGYEHFDYSSQAFNGVLKGDGWTTGAYLGWRLAPNLRFDTAAAWSSIDFNEAAGSAAGRFPGHRLLVSGGITGTYGWNSLVIEPSSRVYALWEREDSYIDSLGIVQGARNFETGRASAGAKVTYPLAWADSVNLAPYAGLYSDYYFSRDDALAAGLTGVPRLEGWSARGTFGISAILRGGAQAMLGAEYGGTGSSGHLWTWRLRGRVPF